ncbi:MAG: hypothetical protein BIFFINMI_01316 [Phycisphaerae bacterium]|nr:hypothetical protein [Phycisphaerae bacterium]
MGKIAVEQARRNFSDAVNRAAYGKERLILTRRRKGVAAIVPLEDLELIEAMEDRLDLEEARKVLADPKEKFVPYREARKRLGLK